MKVRFSRKFKDQSIRIDQKGQMTRNEIIKLIINDSIRTYFIKQVYEMTSVFCYNFGKKDKKFFMLIKGFTISGRKFYFSLIRKFLTQLYFSEYRGNSGTIDNHDHHSRLGNLA